MPEEITKEKEDIMLPKPTPEQIALWEEIESSLKEEAIEEEADFIGLPDEIRAYFATSKIAKKIIELAKGYQLGAEQTKKLSDLIKKTATQKINLAELENYLAKELNLGTDKAIALDKDILNEIFGPIREKLKLGTGEQKPTPPSSTPPSPTPASPALPSTAPGEPRIEGNIVDLKREK